MPNQIYFFINNQEVGPYDEPAARGMLGSGQIKESDFCWFEGLAEWKPVSEVLPGLCSQVKPPVPAGTSGTVAFEVTEREYFKVPKITLHNAEVVLEAGALH